MSSMNLVKWRLASFVCVGLALVLMQAGCGRSEAPEAVNAAAEAIERTTEKGLVKLTLRVTPKEPRLSDLVEMDVVVNSQPDVEIKPPVFGEAVGDFLVRNYSERSPKPATASANGETTRVFHCQLEPVKTGIHLIRSLAIEFVDNRPASESKGKSLFIESEPIEVKVTSELGDQIPVLAALEPMLPPQDVDQPGKVWWWLGLFAGVVVAFLFVIRRRRKRIREAPVVQLSPEEIAHTALKTLLAEDLPSKGLFKDFYLRLTSIVRTYIEGTTGLRAPEQTTEEFLREIRGRDVFPAERSVRLKEFLEAADMVKYAGQQPGADQVELSIQRAREFVARAENPPR